jgi:hypothetical protein
MPSRNPFEPPRGSVEDVRASVDLPTQLHESVGRAFKLLIGSALLGLFSYTARGMTEPLGMTAIGLAVVVGFAFLIRAGQNWARILLLVFVVLGTAVILLMGATLARQGALYVAILVVQTVLQCYAVWLVFRPPGNLWFKRKSDVGS